MSTLRIGVCVKIIDVLFVETKESGETTQLMIETMVVGAMAERLLGSLTGNNNMHVNYMQLQRPVASDSNLTLFIIYYMDTPLDIFAQDGWQELDASSRRSSEMMRNWRGLCPAVDCSGLMMMLMMMDMPYM
jgi:hypothetical protein